MRGNMKQKSYKHEEYKYLVNIYWSDKDGVYVAEVPELPGCATHGSSIKAAATRINDAIEEWIESIEETRYPIPEPISTKKYSGKFVTRIPPEIHRRLTLKATEKGKSLNRFVEEILQEAV